MESAQLELSLGSPYTVRFPINDALAFFWEYDWRFTAKSKNTRKCVDRIKEFFSLEGLRYVDEVAQYHIEGLRRWLKGEGLKENTINTHHMIVTRWFNFLSKAKKQGKMAGSDFTKVVLPSENPGSLVKKVDEKQFERGDAYPKKIVKKLIRAAIFIGDLDIAEMIEFRYMCPLRPGDLFSMTDKNVNLPRRIISGVQNKNVRRSNPSGTPYFYTLPPAAVRILERRLASTPPGEPLFKKRNFQKRWNKVRMAAGLPNAIFILIRHSAITLLMDNNVDLETIRKMGGWTTVRMIPTYVKQNLTPMREAQKKLSDEKTEIIGVK